MIYRFLKIIAQIALRIFYKEVIISKSSELPEKGAIIGVGNHPNTFMDPIIVATIFKQQVGFLGNASIFVHPIVNAIFKYFRVIRVYRKKDVAEGEVMDNTDAFRESYKYLTQGNTLLIFPEGNSYREMKLRKIKTGAARIAFNTEKNNDYTIGVKIVPFGLNYSNPGRFRSKLYVNIGKPISVADFINDYKKDEVNGVKLLTKKIRSSLEENLITTNDEEHETLFLQLKKIYKKRLVGKFKKTENSEEEYRLTKELSKAIQYFKISNPEKFELIKKKIDKYLLILNDMNLKGSAIYKLTTRSKKIMYPIVGLLYAIAGFPIYLFGLIQNYLPYIFPYWVARKITKEIEYHAPIMMTLGVLLFPIYYFLSTYLFSITISDNAIQTMIYLIILPLTGFYTLHYSDYLKNIRNFFKLNPVFKSPDLKTEELLVLKKEINHILDDARNTYLKRL